MPERRRIPVALEDIPSVPSSGEDEAEEPCDCPRLDSVDWNEVESDWGDITFLRSATNAVLGVPVGYAGTRDALRAKAAALGARIPEDAMLLMGAGQFRRPVMLEVEGLDPSTRGVWAPGGVAYTRLLPAPWGELKKLVKETESMATAKYGRRPDGVWVWYLTCRICSAQRSFETLILAHYGTRR
ncbi:MAG TPA: hydrolase [Tepidiformaceae bacterium]